MNYRYIAKLNYLTELIAKENTGNAQELAERLQVSRRTLFRYLEDLKIMGAEISYSKKQNSYVFDNVFSFFDVFFKRVL